MCPQITKIDIMNAIKNMTSRIATVYRDEKLGINFYIDVCCGIEGNPYLNCGWSLGNFHSAGYSSKSIWENAQIFNEEVRKYYETNWYKEEFK